MIVDLDNSLAELLKQELLPVIGSSVNISFATPDGDFPPSSVTLPAVDLFLYDVRENMELRSNDWIITKNSDGSTTRKRPPVRVECSYMITAWPAESTPNPPQDEHYMLGEVMKVLLRHPVLPNGILKGSLKDQEPPLPTVTLQAGQLQSLGEFWQALGGKPKAVLNYKVIISVDVHKTLVSGPAVIDKHLKFKVGTEED
ncbi:MAG: DUF4255 domain-containing protein [Desulfobacteraceae bacterium]|jgi:hypothetical protein